LIEKENDEEEKELADDGGAHRNGSSFFCVYVRRARFIVVPTVIQTKVLHAEIYDVCIYIERRKKWGE